MTSGHRLWQPEKTLNQRSACVGALHRNGQCQGDFGKALEDPLQCPYGSCVASIFFCIPATFPHFPAFCTWPCVGPNHVAQLTWGRHSTKTVILSYPSYILWHCTQVRRMQIKLKSLVSVLWDLVHPFIWNDHHGDVAWSEHSIAIKKTHTQWNWKLNRSLGSAVIFNGFKN